MQHRCDVSVFISDNVFIINLLDVDNLAPHRIMLTRIFGRASRDCHAGIQLALNIFVCAD